LTPVPKEERVVLAVVLTAVLIAIAVAVVGWIAWATLKDACDCADLPENDR
jgi:hypothetical protein